MFLLAILCLYPFRMENYKLKLAAVLFFLGILGVLSMLTVSIDTSGLPADLINEMPPIMLKVLPLLSPLILVIISIAIGTPLYDTVNLSVPTVSNIIFKQEWQRTFVEQLKYGAKLYPLLDLRPKASA